MERKSTVDQLIDKMKPVSSLKELLDAYIKLVKNPDGYSEKVIEFSKKTGKPIKKIDVPEFTNRIPIDTGGGTRGMKVDFKIVDGVYEYKGKLFSVTSWSDQREGYSGSDIEVIKPIKVK